jgi:hypothetical protein
MDAGFFYYGTENKMVAATPSAKAPPSVVTRTVIKLPRTRARLAAVKAVQFGGLGPTTVAIIPVAVGVTPQSVLTKISAEAVCPTPNGLFRILKAKPVSVVACGITKVLRAKSAEEVPNPKKSRVPTD